MHFVTWLNRDGFQPRAHLRVFFSLSKTERCHSCAFTLLPAFGKKSQKSPLRYSGKIWRSNGSAAPSRSFGRHVLSVSQVWS